MTSNQERATNLLANSEFEGRTLHSVQARAIAQALADTGLITPDLPEPSENSAGEAAINGDGFYIEISGNEAIINDTIAFYKECLKDLGLALLAAAEHMEKNE